MNKKQSDYLQKRFKDLSFWNRIKQKIKIVSLSKQEVNAMKTVLINEAKPVYIPFHESDDNENKLIVQLFDERIETLPKGEVYDLYNIFIELKNADTNEYKEFMLSYFRDNMDLTYSLDRWFREKQLELLKSHSI